MVARVTPAVKAAEAAKLKFRLMEYEYDHDAEAKGMQAAEAIGLPPSQVFKTLVAVLEGGEMVCAAIPADAHLSLKALAHAAGAKHAEMAEPAKAERATGYVVGGISPFGQKKRMRLFIDASALEQQEIVVSAGRRGLQIAAAPADMAQALKATLCPLKAAV